jgi:hypothetical protein
MNPTAQKNTDYPEILRKTLALAESWQNRALDLVMIIYEYLNAESDKKLFDRLPYSRCQIQDFLLNDITEKTCSNKSMNSPLDVTNRYGHAGPGHSLPIEKRIIAEGVKIGR